MPSFLREVERDFDNTKFKAEFDERRKQVVTLAKVAVGFIGTFFVLVFVLIILGILKLTGVL